MDSSALLAVLRREPEAEACTRALAAYQPARISAVNYIEGGDFARTDLDLIPLEL
ncbi:MAG: type II toxin-antitoxin system VapC family toxin [Terriglobales bacterium]